MSSWPTDSSIVAKVRPSDAGDRLVVEAADRGREGELRTRLTESLGAPPKRGADGLSIPPGSTPLLLDASAGGVELLLTDEARRFAENRAMAAERHPRLRQAVADLRAKDASSAAGIDSEHWHGRLDGHQVQNVAALTHPDCYGLCLFDEQGAGKTVSVIAAWDVLCARDEVDRMLVVAPKSMLAEWARDLERFCPGKYGVQVLTGGMRSRRAALARPADVIVCNFETVTALESELRALLSRGTGRSLLVCDESFMVKNLDAVRSRSLRRVREWAARAWVLCGTPAPNAPSDLIGQFELADLGVTFAGITLPEDRAEAAVVAAGALSDRGVWLRSLKRDVLPDLPSKAFDVVRLEMAPQQNRAYEAARQGLVEDLRAVDEHGFRRNLASFAARRAALLQLTSNPAAVLSDYAETPAKLAALESLVNELVVSDGEKIVVWSFFTRSLDAVYERFSHLGAVRYDGQVTDVDERREAVRRFQEDPDCRLFVANPAAAGAGLTLHAARIAVYESFSNQAAHFLQSLDRIHRRGQERDVRYVMLLCEDTIDEVEFDRLKRKEAAAQDLLGDVVDVPITREVMLKELVRPMSAAEQE
jgi:SNF2 family DNA or RNA helicase